MQESVITRQETPHGVVSDGAPRADEGPGLPPAIVHVVRRDAFDASDLHGVLKQLGAYVVAIDNTEGWVEAASKDPHPPDLVIVVGRAESLLTSGILREAATKLDAHGVLVAATGAEVEHAAGFMNQGATGLVLLPPAGPTELLDAVRGPFAAASASRGQRRRRAELRRCMQTITRGEAEVLQSLLEGAANKQIAQKLGIGLRTVELRRSKLMRKMNASTISQLILHVAEAGVDRVPPLLLGRKRAPRS